MHRKRLERDSTVGLENELGKKKMEQNFLKRQIKEAEAEVEELGEKMEAELAERVKPRKKLRKKAKSVSLKYP